MRMNIKFRSSQAFKIMIGLCLTPFSLLAAEVIHVSECQNLQKVINDAADGDILKLHGKFQGTFKIKQKSLTLKGTEESPAILNGLFLDTVLDITGIQTLPAGEEQITINLENLIIENGASKSAGGGIFNSFAKLNLSSVILKNNHASVIGGGISNSNGEIVIRHSTIVKNISAIGAGIDCRGGKLSIHHSYITDNKASFEGGGIFVLGSILNLMHTHILKNRSSLKGGGVANHSSNTSISHCTIKENKAASNGGGFYNEIDGMLTLKNSKVILNEAGSSGGGIFNAGASMSLDLDETEVSHNSPDNIFPTI